jgi:hypothetical protein
MTTRRELRLRIQAETSPERRAAAERVLAAHRHPDYPAWAAQAKEMLTWAHQATEAGHRDLLILVQEKGSPMPFDAVACLLPEYAGTRTAEAAAAAGGIFDHVIDTTAIEDDLPDGGVT